VEFRVGAMPGAGRGLPRPARNIYQAVEKRDLRRWTSSFVIAAYCMYASFFRIRPPCISSFLTGLPVMQFINGCY